MRRHGFLCSSDRSKHTKEPSSCAGEVFSGVVFTASVALSLSPVGDSSSILSVSHRNKSLHMVVSTIPLRSLLLITCAKVMPVVHKSKMVVHGGTINTALTPQSIHQKNIKAAAIHTIVSSLHAHTPKPIVAANGLRAELLDVRSIHSKSASQFYHRAVH